MKKFLDTLKLYKKISKQVSSYTQNNMGERSIAPVGHVALALRIEERKPGQGPKCR